MVYVVASSLILEVQFPLLHDFVLFASLCGTVIPNRLAYTLRRVEREAADGTTHHTHPHVASSHTEMQAAAICSFGTQRSSRLAFSDA
jgi:hypothetical protein